MGINKTSSAPLAQGEQDSPIIHQPQTNKGTLNVLSFISLLQTEISKLFCSHNFFLSKYNSSRRQRKYSAYFESFVRSGKSQISRPVVDKTKTMRPVHVEQRVHHSKQFGTKCMYGKKFILIALNNFWKSNGLFWPSDFSSIWRQQLLRTKDFTYDCDGCQRKRSI